MNYVGIVITVIYDIKLVLLSVLIIVLTSYFALEVVGQIVVAQESVGKLWLGNATTMATIDRCICCDVGLQLTNPYNLQILNSRGFDNSSSCHL